VVPPLEAGRQQAALGQGPSLQAACDAKVIPVMAKGSMLSSSVSVCMPFQARMLRGMLILWCAAVLPGGVAPPVLRLGSTP
jgi:hypothetical protein